MGAAVPCGRARPGMVGGPTVGLWGTSQGITNRAEKLRCGGVRKRDPSPGLGKRRAGRVTAVDSLSRTKAPGRVGMCLRRESRMKRPWGGSGQAESHKRDKVAKS